MLIIYFNTGERIKIISWNVNGLKSIIENGFIKEILNENPDILCFQEVKSTEIPEIEGYYSFNNPCTAMPNFYIYQILLCISKCFIYCIFILSCKYYCFTSIIIHELV